MDPFSPPALLPSSCGTPSAADPDVDGIGIRYSIYGQALLALVPAFLRLLFAYPPPSEEREMPPALHDAFKATSAAVLTTGIALLIAAFIEGRALQLDVYDALIVLQLSLLNNLTAAFPAVYMLYEHKGWKTIRGLTGLGLFTVHSIATGAFGIWLFSDIDAWIPGCATDLYVVLGGHVLQASGSGLRAAVLFVSVILVIPGVNGFGIILIVYMLRFFKWTIFQWIPLAIWLVPIVVMICSVEQFIFFNSFAVSGAIDQDEWGFGQVTAIMMLIFPVYIMSKQGIQLLWHRFGWRKEEEDAESAHAGEDNGEAKGVSRGGR